MGVGKEKRKAHKNWSMGVPEKAAPVTRATLRTTSSVVEDIDATHAREKVLRALMRIDVDRIALIY